MIINTCRLHRTGFFLLCWVAVGCSSAEADPDTANAGTGNSAGTAGQAQGGAGGTETSGGSAGAVAGSEGASAGANAGGTSNAGTAGQAQGGAGGSAGDAAGAGGDSGGSAGAGGSPALPEGIPQGYTLQYSQSFADAASLNDILAGNPTSWTHDAGGFLNFTGTGYGPPATVPESLTSFAIVAPKKFGSFVLEVELMQTNNTDPAAMHRDLCIVFNAQNDAQFFYAHIAQFHDDRSHNIHLINNAARQPITALDNGGIQWGVDEWHKIRLVRDATAGTVEVFFDDNLQAPIITAAPNTTFTDGHIGFGTFQDSGRVRNLNIWAAASTDEAATAAFYQ